MPLNAVKIADLQAHKVGGGVWHAAGVHNNSQDSTLAQNHPWNVKKERKKKVTQFPFKLEERACRSAVFRTIFQIYNGPTCHAVLKPDPHDKLKD